MLLQQCGPKAIKRKIINSIENFFIVLRNNNIKEHFKLFKSKDNTSSEGYYEVGSVKTVAATVLSRNKTPQHFVT